jgi:hypothetical protein
MGQPNRTAYARQAWNKGNLFDAKKSGPFAFACSLETAMGNWRCSTWPSHAISYGCEPVMLCARTRRSPAIVMQQKACDVLAA